MSGAEDLTSRIVELRRRYTPTHLVMSSATLSGLADDPACPGQVEYYGNLPTFSGINVALDDNTKGVVIIYAGGRQEP